MVEFNSERNLKIDGHFNFFGTEDRRVIKTRSPGGIQTHTIKLNLMSGSIASLIEILKLKIMHVFRALLEERSVVFYGEKLKVQKICELVASCQVLMQPLNLINKIHPLEHIQSLRIFRNSSGWVMGFTNPLVKNQKTLGWHILVDINQGKVFDKEMKPLGKEQL